MLSHSMYKHVIRFFLKIVCNMEHKPMYPPTDEEMLKLYQNDNLVYTLTNAYAAHFMNSAMGEDLITCIKALKKIVSAPRTVDSVGNYYTIAAAEDALNNLRVLGHGDQFGSKPIGQGSIP